MEHHSAFALLRLRGWRALGAWATAATLLSGAGLLSARSAMAAVALQPSGLATADLQLLAQSPDGTILLFENSNFAVRVFQQNGQTLMNVYRKSGGGGQVLDAQPAAFRANSGPGNTYSSYESFGSFEGQPASFNARVDAVNNTLLEIFNSQSGALLRQEFGSTPPNPTVVLPADQRPGAGIDPNDSDTRLAFSTIQYSTRVFLDTDGILKMNVYTINPSTPVLNGAAAAVVTNPGPPYESYVSYVANGTLSGVSVQAFTRISGSGQTVLEFVDSSGRTLLSQPGTGPVTINIPTGDLPPGVGETPSLDANLNPFIAAVFGDEATLEQLRQLSNSFSPGSTTLLQSPQFESAPQGRFINAGSFTNRDEASALVNYLRSQGYNARLIHRDFNYR